MLRAARLLPSQPTHLRVLKISIYKHHSRTSLNFRERDYLSFISNDASFVVVLIGRLEKQRVRERSFAKKGVLRRLFHHYRVLKRLCHNFRRHKDE